MKDQNYRCGNEYSSDPCEWAKNNHKITSDEVPSAMDSGNPKCPGKTLSGGTCGHELIPVASQRSSFLPMPSWLLIAGLVTVMALLSVDLGLPSLFDGLFNGKIDPPREVVTSPPSPQKDPWWVYRELEKTSTLLQER